jgi:hypothetical protein
LVRFVLLLTLLVVVLVALNRNRLFLRDPLGEVERSDTRVADARVFINYSNDVLVQAGSQIYLVQAWNSTPGVPMKFTCMQGLLCLTDQDQATSLPLRVGDRIAESVVMTNREVSFVDGAGMRVRIKLR